MTQGKPYTKDGEDQIKSEVEARNLPPEFSYLEVEKFFEVCELKAEPWQVRLLMNILNSRDTEIKVKKWRRGDIPAVRIPSR